MKKSLIALASATALAASPAPAAAQHWGGHGAGGYARGGYANGGGFYGHRGYGGYRGYGAYRGYGGYGGYRGYGGYPYYSGYAWPWGLGLGVALGAGLGGAWYAPYSYYPASPAYSYYDPGYSAPAPQAGPYACGSWIWHPESYTYAWAPCAPGGPNVVVPPIDEIPPPN